MQTGLRRNALRRKQLLGQFTVCHPLRHHKITSTELRGFARQPPTPLNWTHPYVYPSFPKSQIYLSQITNGQGACTPFFLLCLSCTRVRWVALWQKRVWKKSLKIPPQTLRKEFGAAGWSHEWSQFLPGFSPPVFPQLFLHNRVGKNWVADFVSVKLHYWEQLIGSVA